MPNAFVAEYWATRHTATLFALVKCVPVLLIFVIADDGSVVRVCHSLAKARRIAHIIGNCRIEKKTKRHGWQQVERYKGDKHGT